MHTSLPQFKDGLTHVVADLKEFESDARPAVGHKQNISTDVFFLHLNNIIERFRQRNMLRGLKTFGAGATGQTQIFGTEFTVAVVMNSNQTLDVTPRPLR